MQSLSRYVMAARCALLLTLLPAASVLAQDQVILKNGDRITGEIQQIWGGELLIEPAYADEFAIELSAIEQVLTNRSFEFELDDERKITGTLEVDEAGGMMLVTADRRQPIALTDIEELEEINAGWDWKVRTDLSLDGSAGNSEDNQFTWQGYGRIANDTHRHEVNLRIDQASQDGVTSQDRMRANYVYSWFMSDYWFLQAGIGGERDPVRDLDRRVSAGGGLGYQFFDDADRRLEVSLSAVGIDEALGGDTSQSLAARWSADFRHDLLGGDLEFFHDQSVWHYLSGRDTTLIQTSTGFRWDVWADIYFNTQFDWDYETDPARGAEKEDIQYMLGLGVEFD
ncbi:DUF481 domain-containing protein [Halochromatium glycolicum]|uniref:Salt-induced outer membrane protein YdiY n=1 Tax=Halochromatium glycolicum TaxID=85075 RepID=A0AAJ0U8L8_9GAMM|nr:DUF481 domain-containing protein [Halochromatium glycolicum]MBK1706467.1 hypothetical protein [Halochromatium glycolicum]